MTTLHRYCPDHTPERALCGTDLAGAVELADEAVATDPRPACVVCDAIHGLPCEDACLALREDKPVRVLRACEAVEIDASGEVQCTTPGQWWEAPNGKSYLVCEHHRSVFGRGMA